MWNSHPKKRNITSILLIAMIIFIKKIVTTEGPKEPKLVVIPAKAGIHAWRLLDSRLRGNDDQIGGLNGYIVRVAHGANCVESFTLKRNNTLKF